MLKHGGRLRQAVKQYAIPQAEWVDVSTGINPSAWPVPDLPALIWQRLPEDDDGLEAAAQAYYGCGSLLPVSGSQAAIQALPQLRGRAKVMIPHVGYAEHGHAWQKAGHEVVYYQDGEIPSLLPETDVLVVINPNNPSGHYCSTDELLEWRQHLVKRGGLLVVDEAFMDSTPEQSLLPYCPLPGLVVLRSLGKFFGLAGLRLGFVIAEPDILMLLREHLGPWSVSNPARWVGAQALGDVKWQFENRRNLLQQGRRLAQLLEDHFSVPSVGTALFQTILLEPDRVPQIVEQLAKQGILVRVLDKGNGLRFGLPSEDQWPKLITAVGLLDVAIFR